MLKWNRRQKYYANVAEATFEGRVMSTFSLFLFLFFTSIKANKSFRPSKGTYLTLLCHKDLVLNLKGSIAATWQILMILCGSENWYSQLTYVMVFTVNNYLNCENKQKKILRKRYSSKFYILSFCIVKGKSTFT